MGRATAEIEQYKPTPADQYRENAEGRKLLYDMLKHITTLSTATALLMVTVSDKVLPHPLPTRTLLGLTVAFVFIAASAFLGMFFWATARHRVSKNFAFWAVGTTVVAVVGYLVMLFLSVTTVMNAR